MSFFSIEPEIVLGPPGCGKTTTLINYVEEELSAGTPPDRIGYVSFTRRAAQEAISRAKERFSLPASDFPYFRTLHSLCLRRLGASSQQILDGQRLQDFAHHIGESITGRWSAEDGFAPGQARGDRLLHMDNMARVRTRTLKQQYDESCDDLDWTSVDRFSRGLREYKHSRDLLDYTDLLSEFVRGGSPPELDVLFVDEAQDLSRLQWDVVRILGSRCRRLVVVGDDDQSIYKWSGADPEVLIGMEGRSRVLGQSWRVPLKVQNLALKIIGKVSHRREKTWASKIGEDGVLSWMPSVGDIDWSGPDILVLGRNRFLLEQVERQLWSSGTFYSRGGHPSIRQPILDAVVAWERLRAGERILAENARRAYELLNLGTGVKRGHKKLPNFPDGTMLGMQDLVDNGGLQRTDIWHQALEKIPAIERTYMVRCRRNGERFSVKPRINVATIHESKGGEAERVVLLTDMAHRTYSEMENDPDSEHRVMYVGATRAKKELTVISPRTPLHYAI